MAELNSSSIEEKLNDLEKKFKWHNHADGYSQPVFLPTTTQGTAYNITPPVPGILGENVSNGNALAVRSDGKIYKADSTSQANCDAFVGIANADGIAGESAVYITAGFKTDYNGLTPGTVYYLTNTPGVIGTSPGSYTRKIAIAINPTTLMIGFI
ncbi:MAG: hypothetical protein QW076_00355 [Candidatus Anstonellales archaeon]